MRIPFVSCSHRIALRIDLGRRGLCPAAAAIRVSASGRGSAIQPSTRAAARNCSGDATPPSGSRTRESTSTTGTCSRPAARRARRVLPAPSGPTTRTRTAPSPALADLASALADRLDTRVRVDMGKTKGRLVVEFASVADLERIIALMAPPVTVNGNGDDPYGLLEQTG